MMAEFDPDAYLKKSESFDPDAYLKGADASPKPKSEKSFFERLAEADRKRMEVEKGFASGMGQFATGVGELVPYVGESAAKAGKELQKFGDPTAQTIGKVTTGFMVPAGLFGKTAAEGLPLAKRAWEGVKEGAKIGAGFGLMEPTYDEKTGRYITKLEHALGGGVLGAVIGGPLAAAFGRRAPTISVESVMEQAQKAGQSMFDAARKMANEKFGEGTKKAEQEFISILQEAERQKIDLKGAQLKREIATRKVAGGERVQPIAEDVNLAQSRTEVGLPNPTTSEDIAKNIDPNSVLRQLGQNALVQAEKAQDVGGKAFANLAKDAQELEKTSPVGSSPFGQEFKRFLIDQIKGGAGDLKTAGSSSANLAQEVLSELFNKKRPVSFNLWEEKLRELRQRTQGKVAEGFTPIQIKRINSVADKLEETLNNWIGRDVAAEIYATSSEAKNKFVSDLGKALTQKETIPYNATEGMFKTPETALQKTVFESADAVRYAKELMGEQPINKIGEQYAMDTIRDMNSSSVKKWLDSDKSEFLNGIPNLREKITKYSEALAEREGRSKAMEALQTQLRGGIRESQKALEQSIEQIDGAVKKAAKARGTALTDAERELTKTLSTINKFNETIRRLPPEKILEKWPEARIQMEQTGLFNPQELDALGNQLSQAAKIAEQKAREEAATGALLNAVKVIAKKAGIPIGLIGGVAGGATAIYKSVTD